MGAEVVCVGILVADMVGTPMDNLPPRGKMAVLDRIELHIGGCAANTGADLARIGVPVAVVGKVGADSLGDFLVDALKRRGVETAGVRRADNGVPTAATIVAVHSDAERSFSHVPGANAAFMADDMDWSVAEGARILHVAGLQLLTAFEGQGAASVLAEAKRRGLITTLDTVLNPQSLGWEGVVPCLPYLDWALPSLYEAELLTGETDPGQQAAKLKAHGTKNVAVKMGDEGCYISPESGEPFTVPALPLRADEVKDALGAGDAWVAGFLAGLIQGWTLQFTALYANAVGADCVRELGATTGIRPMADTLATLHLPGGESNP